MQHDRLPGNVRHILKVGSVAREKEKDHGPSSPRESRKQDKVNVL